MFVAATLAILITMALALTRLCLGPTIYDRILAVNMFGTKTVLLIAVLGYLTGRPDFLDIALVYALINFIGTIAVLKFLRYGGFGDTHRVEDDIGSSDPSGPGAP
ncbi:MAG: cation:proton antiporter [Rhodospirillales bacterium]|nr:cation:proton antiporter [Rhodospirillales bacterium]